MTATRRKLDKMVKRNAELSVLFKRLYADNVLGKISIPSLEMVVQQMAEQTQVPSIDRGRLGFDGQKCAHTASSPLTIRQYSLRAFPRLDTFLLRQNCPHLPAMDLRVIFGF